MTIGNPTSTAPLVGIYNTDQMPSLTFQAGATITGVTLVNPTETVLDNVFTVENATDITKTLVFSLAGQTTATQATLATSNTAAATYTFPTATQTLVGRTSTDTLTNKTLTAPVLNNPVISGPAPVAVGSSATAAGSSGTYLLNTVGGSTLTLPAATGTGNKYRVIVTATTTSAAHKILAASSSDFINGLAFGENAGTAKAFASAAATNHSIQMPFSGSQPSGGFIGDWFEITDVATNLWNVNGMYQAGTTPTTPFSSATT